MSSHFRSLVARRLRTVATLAITTSILAPGALAATAAAARGHHPTTAATRRAAAEARCSRASSGAARASGPRAAARRAAAARFCTAVALKSVRGGANRPPSVPKGGKHHGGPGPVLPAPPATGTSETPPPPESPPRTKKKGPPGTGGGGLPQEENGIVTDPIDSRFLTKDPFGAVSFWIQPWRAYLDTWPNSTLQNSLGINFNVTASPGRTRRPAAPGKRVHPRPPGNPLGRAELRKPQPVPQRAEDRGHPDRAAHARPAAADPPERQQRRADAGQTDHADDHRAAPSRAR